MNTLLLSVAGILLLIATIWLIVKNNPGAPAPDPVESEPVTDATPPLVFTPVEVEVTPLSVDAALEAVTPVTEPEPAKPVRKPRVKKAPVEAPAAEVNTVVEISGTATPVKKTRAKKTTPTVE